MSVYKPKKSPHFHYDFVVQGQRYHGSTGVGTKRDAEAFERQRRAEIASGGALDAGDITIDMAASRWYDECGRDLRSAPDLLRRLDVMAKCVGPTRTLRSITGLVISEAIEKRRKISYRGKAPANATVNRDIISPARSVLRRARLVWGARNMPEIAWGQLTLREAPGCVREYTTAEQQRWLGELTDSDQLALRMLLRYGLRFGELFFCPSNVDVTGARLTIRDRKAQEFPVLVLPLTSVDAVTIGRLASKALANGEPNIWGRTYWSLYHRIRRAALRSKLPGARLIHGARHHAATQMAREGGIHLAKRLLGHASIASTARYAHAAESDLRAALEGLSRNSPEPADEAPQKTSENPRSE